MGEREELRVVEPFMPVMSMALNSEHLHRITREQLAIAIDLIERLRTRAQRPLPPLVTEDDGTGDVVRPDHPNAGAVYPVDESLARSVVPGKYLHRPVALRAPEAADAGAVAPKEPPEWLWWGEVDGKDVVTFGRWPKRGAQWRYKLAQIQPTEHDHAFPTDAGMRERVIEECAAIARRAGCSDPKCMSCYGNQIAAEIEALAHPSTDGKGGA